jgi:hypothetical protein
MKARIQGSQAKLIFFPEGTGVVPLDLGELDEFEATQMSEVVKRRPMGYSIESTTYKYSGWNLSFRGGKVDWKLARWAFNQDRSARIPGKTNGFSILQTINHFDTRAGGIPAVEQYLYTNVVLFGLEQKLRGGEDITEEMKGYCGKREIGPVDTSVLSVDGVFWNSIAFTASNTDIASEIANIIPSDIKTAINIFRSRPF